MKTKSVRHLIMTSVIGVALVAGCAHQMGSRKIATEPTSNEKLTVEYTLPKGADSGNSLEVFSLTKVSGPKRSDLEYNTFYSWSSHPKFSVSDSSIGCEWKSGWKTWVDRFGMGSYVDSLFCATTSVLPLGEHKTFTVTFDLAPFQLSEEEVAARRKLLDNLQIRQRLNEGIYDRSFFLAAEHLRVLHNSASSIYGGGGTGDSAFLKDMVIRVDEVSGSSRVGLFGKKVDASGLAGEKEKHALIPVLPIRKRWPDLKERPYAVLCKAGDRVVFSSARASSQGFLLKAGEKFQCIVNAPQKGLAKVRDASLTVKYSLVFIDEVNASIKALDSAVKEEREARLTAIQHAFRTNKGEVYEPSLKVLKDRIKFNQKWSQFSKLIPATLSVESETGFILAKQKLLKSDETGLDGTPISYVDFSLGVGAENSEWLAAYVRKDHAVGESAGVFRPEAATPVAKLDANGYHMIAIPNDIASTVQTRTRYEDSVVRAEDGVLRTFCHSELEALGNELSAAAAPQATGQLPALQDLMAILDRFDHGGRGVKTTGQTLQECAALGSGVTKTSVSLNGVRFIAGLKTRSELSGREMVDFVSLVPRRIELAYKFEDIAVDGPFGMMVPVMPEEAGSFAFLSGSIDSKVQVSSLPEAMRSRLDTLEWVRAEKDQQFFNYNRAKMQSGMKIFDSPFAEIVGRDSMDLGWLQENLK